MAPIGRLNASDRGYLQSALVLSDSALSTSNAIFYPAAFSRRFEPRRSRSGIKVGLQPDPDHDPIVATAAVNVSMPFTLTMPSQFHSGRQLAAWLGLVPRQYSSGGKERFGRISKRGDGYIRRLLVHGARADLRWSKHRKEQRSIWQESLLARRPTNVVLVATYKPIRKKQRVPDTVCATLLPLIPPLTLAAAGTGVREHG